MHMCACVYAHVRDLLLDTRVLGCARDCSCDCVWVLRKNMHCAIAYSCVSDCVAIVHLQQRVSVCCAMLRMCNWVVVYVGIMLVVPLSVCSCCKLIACVWLCGCAYCAACMCAPARSCFVCVHAWLWFVVLRVKLCYVWCTGVLRCACAGCRALVRTSVCAIARVAVKVDVCA